MKIKQYWKRNKHDPRFLGGVELERVKQLREKDPEEAPEEEDLRGNRSLKIKQYWKRNKHDPRFLGGVELERVKQLREKMSFTSDF